MRNDNLPTIKSHGGNMYSIGGNMFFLGGMGIDSKAGQFMSKNQGALMGGAALAGQAIDLAAPDTIGGGAAKGALSGASMGAALGPWGALAGGVIGGGLSAINAKKDQDKARQQLAMSNLAKGSSMRAGLNADTGNIYAADGGELPGITQFNNGGTHEQNPLGGIPQGISQQNGQPNFVEQGETKRAGFIYSDRLPVINAKDFLLPKKYEGKTFADASKLASKYIKDRPYDNIAKKGQDIVLNRLKSANEEAIQMKQMAEQFGEQPSVVNQAKMGGKTNSCAYGGFTFTDY